MTQSSVMHDYAVEPYSALWLSVSPHLQRFDNRLIQQLAQSTTLYHWEYQQTMDEPCSIEVALVLLHDYLKHQAEPVHLIGHGISGIVGLLYACRHPGHVASLTLLSVGANPAVTWHSHYYALRKLLPCRRSTVLLQLARLLFGAYSADVLHALANRLENDLDQSLTLHSLLQQTSLEVGTIGPSLFVCQGEQDVILDP
ncbi:MAG: alpha/beta fold hydrolase, partial [Merismopedia sp. SIO2A8]|nr:alpha/beta fold hydrolase [Merismopedia sp. SIO2A8]